MEARIANRVRPLYCIPNSIVFRVYESNANEVGDLGLLKCFQNGHKRKCRTEKVF